MEQAGEGETAVWIRPAAAAARAATELSSFDQLTFVTSTSRGWAFSGRLDELALRQALQATVNDLPALAGRLGRKPRGRLRLSAIFIAHPTEDACSGRGGEGGGVLLTTVHRPDLTLAALGPDAWPHKQRRLEGAAAAPPLGVPDLDTRPRALLRGKQPLLKAQLTRLADGDLLGITLAHVLTDGVRWPRLAGHLAARYRQAAGGGAADPGALLAPGDRTHLSLEHYKKQHGLPGWQPPPSLAVRGSLRGYWRVLRAALQRRRQGAEIVLLFVPQERVAALKAAAGGGNPAVTTGDAVQAAAALLLHAAAGLPPLPVAPKAMSVMLQMPGVPEGYFGNAVRMLPVSAPGGSAQPAAGEWQAALAALAGAIRRAVAAFRTKPEEQLLAVAEAEAFVAAPLPRLLAHLARRYLPLLTASTNYVPQEQAIDLGLGPPAWTRQLSRPVAPGMATIRPAQPPYPPGLFFHLCLTERQAAALRGLPLVQAMLPGACWVGGGGSCGHGSGSA